MPIAARSERNPCGRSSVRFEIGIDIGRLAAGPLQRDDDATLGLAGLAYEVGEGIRGSGRAMQFTHDDPVNGLVVDECLCAVDRLAGRCCGGGKRCQYSGDHRVLV